MPNKIYNHFTKILHKKYFLFHGLITTILLLGFFGIIKTTNAQSSGFYITSGGNYNSYENYGTITFQETGLLHNFGRSRNNIYTIFYDTSENTNTIYFNNFDTTENLSLNLVPLADSIRDFPDSNFTGGTIGTGNNGWRYLYSVSSGITSYEWINQSTLDTCATITNPINFKSPIASLPPATTADLIIYQTGCYDSSLIYPDERSRSDAFVCFPVLLRDSIERTCVSTEISSSQKILSGLTHNFGTNIWGIGTAPIITHSFGNIGKNYSHPGSGTIDSLNELSGSSNIPVVLQWQSNLSGKVKFINKIEDDDNNCGNGIIYKIYTGYFIGANSLTGITQIGNYYIPNNSGRTIERSGDIRTGHSLFFEINNSGNNECDGTYNYIQIYDVTTNTGISGGPTYTNTGKYGGALEFSGNQAYSLGTGINQSTSGITIAARINTRDNTKKQGIITKKFSYGVVVKSGTIWISPSTYWMRHDTGLPIENNTRTHVAWTYDGNVMRTYKNGSQIQTYYINGELSGNNNLTMIGYDELNQRGRDGFIDEFRMYDIAFNTGQIKELYDSNLKVANSGTNYYRNFSSYKTGLIDGIYNYLAEYSGEYLTGSWSGTISINRGPIITGYQSIITGYIEKNISLSISGYSSGGTVYYQRYNDTGCVNTISGYTSPTFSTGRDFVTSIFFSYKVYDQLGFGNCYETLFQREMPVFNILEYTTGYNSGLRLNGSNNGQIEITGTDIIQQGSIGNCSTDNNFTYYSGNNLIGNDFCIIGSGSEQIVLGRYGINRYNTIFTTTGTKGILRGQDYVITPTSSQFKIEIENTNLTGLTRSISGKNNPINEISQIYNTGLIGLYNFDKFLLTDSEQDFSEIQFGKNRGYYRRPRGTGAYEQLQYYAPSKKRIISNPMQVFDGLFIEKDQLNPGANYGDTIIGWKSPVNAKIQIDYSLVDENTSCGDGIEYALLHNDTESSLNSTTIATGGFDTRSVIWSIQKDEYIFLKISSKDNNECDNTKHNIKIYQLPESNVAINGVYQGTNSGGTYIEYGKSRGSIKLENGQFINIGTGIQSEKMSISTRVYRIGENPKQAIIQKRGSYGIIIANNTIQVANKNDNRRYDTQLAIPTNKRIHIGRSYDGTNMRVYINGIESRNTTVIGSVNTTPNPTYIGYSVFDGQRDGLIDELYIYQRALSSGEFATLYENNLNKTNRNKWSWTSNQDGSVNDGKFLYNININNQHQKSGTFMRDFNGPELQTINGYTGYESDSLNIQTTWRDLGTDSWPSFGFDRDINGDGIFEYINTIQNITIPAQDEPINETIQVRVKDIFGHTTTKTLSTTRINKNPIANPQTIYKSKINGNINFDSKVSDIGASLSYQRYFGTDCSTIIPLQTEKYFITGNAEPYTGEFSYKAQDSQGLASECGVVTGIWTTGNMLDKIEYITGDGIGGTIYGISVQSGFTIAQQAKKGICTGENIITYIPNTGTKGNDSCIITSNYNNEKTVIAITNIDNRTLLFRTGDLATTGILTGTNSLISSIKIQSPTINGFTGTVNITSGLIIGYNFDKILLSDSEQDFGIFQGEGGWKYFQGNIGENNLLSYDINTNSRIIGEPLQDFEYVILNKNTAYPGSIKYGDIIYERTSNYSGNIIIENTMSDGDTQCGDGFGFTIKQSNNSIFTNEYSYNFTSQNISTKTQISSGEKIYFYINSIDNNQCDKLNFKTKIYTDTIDSLVSYQPIINIQGNPTRGNGKNNGGYIFNNNNQYFNLGTINTTNSTGPTFSMWLKTTDTNGTIIYKEGSYGLIIKSGNIQVTTDGYRRYPTNINTSQLQTRSHITRTYDTKSMKIYLNGKEYWSGNINGYYPTNSNATTLGRSQTQGQLEGTIDELRVYNHLLSSTEILGLYQSLLLKINANERSFIYNQINIEDGDYPFTGYINDATITGQKTIDTKGPVIGLLQSTGRESMSLNMIITGKDFGTSISGYQYRYKITDIGERTSRSNSTGRNQLIDNIITIPVQNEPTSGFIEIKIRDQSQNISIYNANIIRINSGIITSNILLTGNEGSNLIFIALGQDPGNTTNIKYKWYSGANCIAIISGENQSALMTGINEPGTKTFSYTMIDAQGLTGNCSIITGIRNNIAPIGQDIITNTYGNKYIILTGNVSDPGGTNFSYQRYQDTNCQFEIINQTGQTFTTGSEMSGTRSFGYRVRDAQGLTGNNNINTGRNCQISTGVRPYINPIADDFYISTNTSNKLITGNRKTLSNARDPVFNTNITANISSGSKGYCQITNDRISFQPMDNQIGTGFCELIITDGNNRSSKIKGFASNIDTIPPITTITSINYTSFKLIYNDTTTGTSYYKMLTGIWNIDSCGTIGYSNYTSGDRINIPYVPDTTDYKTICFYSIDLQGNKESTKSQLFTQPQDAVPFNVSFSGNEFMNNIFEATIVTNKICMGSLTGLDTVKSLYLSTGTNIITGSFIETNGSKTAYINLQTQNPGEIFNYAHTFTIDQTSPNTPIITESTENNDYYIIKRNPSIDDASGIRGYNYQINNQYTTVKSGFTDATYLNIKKSEIQYNTQIYIKIQAKDKVNNLSQRSSSLSITIPEQGETTNNDTIPDQFYFSKTTNAKPNTIYTSNEIIIGGLSTNTSIPIFLGEGTLFINNIKTSGNTGTVKNGDILYIQLRSSATYNDAIQTTLTTNGISSTYTITTEINGSSTISFLEELRKLVEQLQKEPTNEPTSGNTNIDTTRISAPHIAPNGKKYELYKTLDGRYSSHNFIVKKYFTSLTEMKSYIDKNNPKK